MPCPRGAEADQRAGYSTALLPVHFLPGVRDADPSPPTVPAPASCPHALAAPLTPNGPATLVTCSVQPAPSGLVRGPHTPVVSPPLPWAPFLSSRVRATPKIQDRPPHTMGAPSLHLFPRATVFSSPPSLPRTRAPPCGSAGRRVGGRFLPLSRSACAHVNAGRPRSAGSASSGLTRLEPGGRPCVSAPRGSRPRGAHRAQGTHDCQARVTAATLVRDASPQGGDSRPPHRTEGWQSGQRARESTWLCRGATRSPSCRTHMSAASGVPGDKTKRHIFLML